MLPVHTKYLVLLKFNYRSCLYVEVRGGYIYSPFLTVIKTCGSSNFIYVLTQEMDQLQMATKDR